MMYEIKGIPIRNLFFMLAYAMHVPDIEGEIRGSFEDMKTFDDLLAHILLRCVHDQISVGLYSDYVPEHISCPRISGRILVNGTLRMESRHRMIASCSVSRYSLDNTLNRVVKTTLIAMLGRGLSNDNDRAGIIRVLRHFANVSTVDLSKFRWKDLEFWSGNRGYRCMIDVCRLFHDYVMPSQEKDGTRLREPMMPDDDVMSAVFERFVRNYYLDNFKDFCLGSKKIKWGTYDDELLPQMRTDVYFKSEKRVLIVDTKFYKEMLQKNYSSESQHSSNLYQMLSYMENESYADDSIAISGFILYARSNAGSLPDHSYTICGKRLGVGSLDLSADLDTVKNHLDRIPSDYLSLNDFNNRFADNYHIRS